MALYHFSVKTFSRGSRNTVGAIAYRAGCKLSDGRTGETFDYRSKSVEHVELLLPKNAPEWAVEVQNLIEVDRGKGVQALCTIVESAEKRVDARVWREFEFALHRELTKEQNMALAREFVQDQICTHGMAAQLNFHFDVDPKTKEEKPHCHVVVPTRRLDERGMNSKKEEAWNKKEFLLDLRIQWQEYSNFHLKLHGHDVRIDHRSNKERGIDVEPQPKLGKGVLEQERRAKSRDEKTSEREVEKPSFATDKAQAFHDTQLRNLYRIMRRPEVVLEIVSKHNATFMWADVQKVLHRYVDEIPLFQKLEAKLRNSNELLTLKSDPEDHAIYTTRSMLKAEKSLVETAETLSHSKTHKVQEACLQAAISKANQELEKFGGLSSDQTKAIHHLVEEGQLKCVVGIAGAGKTTALGVCHDIWKESGYAVYGLAPTGKAAQNLEQSGIPSSTLHKFLLSFEEGRSQYNSNSVLVLDEAGMVDMERFEKLLGAVKQLGVKLIVVGDGAQLQPVEAGPAFRLITQRLGKSELNTVLRQKEDWQRDATVLFGKQETQSAIQKYVDKDHVHIVEENLPTTKHSLYETLDDRDREEIVKLYEISSRTSSLIYREMMRDITKAKPAGNTYTLISQHQDFERYQHWRDMQKSAAAQIITDGTLYRPLLEERGLDPLKMAMLFVDKKQDKTAQRQEAEKLLKENNLSSVEIVERLPGQSVDTRKETKEALVQSWLTQFKENPEKSSLMLAFSNRDVGDLNRLARSQLKESGHIEKEDFTYIVKREDKDDFGRKHTTQTSKDFSLGDRIVFTRNTKSLGVKNGTMGTITALDKQTLKVKLDGEEGKEISFSPNLNPYFDQGWAITIHKSQGTTVDHTYVLASYEMTQNLAYVAMTRHRENVQVFGSQLDFWRPEKLPEILSKSGEKLSAADYLDTKSLTKLMQEDDKLITRIFNRISNELEAMGAVSKKAFWQVAGHFLGVKKEKEIRGAPDHTQSSIREEVRAEKVLHKSKDLSHKKNTATNGTKVFEELTQQCIQKLYAYLRDEKIGLTSDLISRVEKQAEKAANFIFFGHTLKGTRPTEKEAKHLLLRAKYELDRILEIRDELIHKWQKARNYKGAKDELISHMIAERQASIEGRMYLEAKQKGLTPLPIIPDLAAKELQAHRSKTETMAQELIKKHGLSESAAIYCAKDILRHQETYGEKPSSTQVSSMVQISRDLDQKNYDPSIGSHNIEYLRRRDGDLQFREMASQGKDLSGFRDFPYREKGYGPVQGSVKPYEEENVPRIIKESSRSYEMDLSI
jgi:Ti-type conjugative transfer relaxase TraA